MNHANNIMKLVDKNNGVITSMEVTKANIPRIYLKILVDKGLLERVERGIYISPNALEDEMYSLQSRFRKGIFSHETALFLHDLTDRTPITYTMTFPAGYNASALKKQNVKICYSIKGRYEIGIDSVNTTYGLKVNAYNAERTLCDLLQKRYNADIQILSDALKRYLTKSKIDIPLLSKYAKIFNVEKQLRPYLEVLT